MNPPNSFTRPGAQQARPLLWGLLVVLLLGIAGAWGWAWYRQRAVAQNALHVYGTVGDFALSERSGRPFGLADLKGHIWVVNFFFSSCTEVCPLTMPQMARLQDAPAAHADRLRLVSITIDPEHDTLPILRAYADRLGAQPDRWYFLTGYRDAIYALSLNTFHIAVEALPEAERQPGQDGFLHGEHFVLADPDAQIRGYYDPLDDEAMTRLRQDIQTLSQDHWGY
jgi:protein SCO1/2